MFRSWFLLTTLAAAAAFPARAAEQVAAVSTNNDSAYLAHFVGRWNGSGIWRMVPGSAAQPIQCQVAGETRGEQLTIQGQCTAAGYRGHVRASLRYNPYAHAYFGTWEDATGSSADISGSRRGDSLVLTVTEATSMVSSAVASRMTVTPQPEGFHFVVQKQGAALVDLAFRH